MLQIVERAGAGRGNAMHARCNDVGTRAATVQGRPHSRSDTTAAARLLADRADFTSCRGEAAGAVVDVAFPAGLAPAGLAPADEPPGGLDVAIRASLPDRPSRGRAAIASRTGTSRHRAIRDC